MIEIALTIAVIYAIVQLERIKRRMTNIGKELLENEDFFNDLETHGDRLKKLEGEFPKLCRWIAEVMHEANIPKQSRERIMKCLEDNY
jgi:hypothetical protein